MVKLFVRMRFAHSLRDGGLPVRGKREGKLDLALGHRFANLARMRLRAFLWVKPDVPSMPNHPFL